MARNNWNNTIKSAKMVQRSAKSTLLVSELLKEFPEEGYMKDNISKNLVKIADCKSSSLRRYVKLLDNYYYTVTNEKDKKLILDKKIEVETELFSRPDATVEEEAALKAKEKAKKAREKRKKEQEKLEKLEKKKAAKK